MIHDGFTYLSFILLWGGILKLLESRMRWKIFNYLPTIVLLYISMMLFSSIGVWNKTQSILSWNKIVQTNILPAMIFLMLLNCDLRKIIRLGPKLLIAFFSASISIMIAFIAAYMIYMRFLGHDSWNAVAALSGSWIGGTGNMVAIQRALHVSNNAMGPIFITDSINYSVWVMILLMLVPYAHIFNRWTKANEELLEKAGVHLEHTDTKKKIGFTEIIFLVGLGFTMSVISQHGASFLPDTRFLNQSSWTVLIATALGICFGMTRIGKIAGSNELANLMLYAIIGLVASMANFSSFREAPLFILMGSTIILIHIILLSIMAKVFKLDLFTCGVASLANIGGVAAAPILAAAYSEALVPVGVLMAMLGYILGTGGGLIVGKILSIIAGF